MTHEPKTVEEVWNYTACSDKIHDALIATAIEAERARIVEGLNGIRGSVGYRRDENNKEIELHLIAKEDILSLLTPSNLSDKTKEV